MSITGLQAGAAFGLVLLVLSGCHGHSLEPMWERSGSSDYSQEDADIEGSKLGTWMRRLAQASDLSPVPGPVLAAASANAPSPALGMPEATSYKRQGLEL